MKSIQGLWVTIEQSITGTQEREKNIMKEKPLKCLKKPRKIDPVGCSLVCPDYVRNCDPDCPYPFRMRREHNWPRK